MQNRIHGCCYHFIETFLENDKIKEYIYIYIYFFLKNTVVEECLLKSDFLKQLQLNLFSKSYYGDVGIV